jgi:hypothetical protein
MLINPLIASLNLTLCCWRFASSLKASRIISIIWFLFGYFAVFFIPVSLEKEMIVYRGFFAEIVRIGESTIDKTILYVFVFNIIFAISEVLFGRLLGGSNRGIQWSLDKKNFGLNLIICVLLLYWTIGTAWYLWETRNIGYRDYVEGSSWACVIFWASSPLISIFAMQKRYFLALILCTPFLFIAVHLYVRSFALLSIVPLCIVSFNQIIDGRTKILIWWKILAAGAILVSLVALSIVVSQYKTGEFAFPDSGMPYGVVQSIGLVDRLKESTGFNSLILYGWNYINPFMKLFRISKPDIADTPVIIARLLEGVPIKWPIYFHYPALLWTDAYISFQWNGLLLAVFWAFVLSCWEWVILKFGIMPAILLPYLSWHNYMLVRGAVAVASVPLAYSGYLSIFAVMLGLVGALYRKQGLSIKSMHEIN